MNYVDGFVIACPRDRKEEFVKHARLGDSVFMEKGALRVVECWGDDVPHGTLTDFHKAVNAEADEVVLFSWIEWPDKKTRDAAMESMMNDGGQTDPRMDPAQNPMPFDGKRMIFGGFVPVVTLEG
jgi:uncharacterized protein YbaA (DUF1428 family)